MKEHINHQVIEQDGKPAFAVISWSDFEKLTGPVQVEEDGLIPHDIVERHTLYDVPLVKCWREYLGLTQSELAAKSGIPQPSIARIESGAVVNIRQLTLEKMAKAMNLEIEQLQG